MLQQTINGIELGVWLLVILALFQEYQPLSVATRVWRESLSAADMLQSPADNRQLSEDSHPYIPAGNEELPLLAV